jgi:23S rRNA (uracil1939-C5)-methyltransferase
MTRPKLLKLGDRIELFIDRLSIGGRGVARHQGIVVFVENVAPKETIEAEVTLLKKNHAEATLLRVLTPSAFRITPDCPVYGVCGGCNWQHLSYSEQLRQKRSLVEESLRKFSGFSVNDGEVREVIASPAEFHYRNRIQLHYQGSKIGFFKRGSHQIVDIERCLIAEEPLNNEIPRLRRALDGKKPGRMELALNADGAVGAESGFSQVNSAQNTQLINDVVNRAIELASHHTKMTVFDLFAGSGNFTFPLATALPQAEIFAAELDPAAVKRAVLAIRRFQDLGQPQFGRISFECTDVGEFLKRSKNRPSRALNPTLIVLDPPRTGCGTEVMTLLAESLPENIFYVSCHPVTLARDLKFLAAVGYRMVRIQPFDMFPQTDHLLRALAFPQVLLPQNVSPSSDRQ